MSTSFSMAEDVSMSRLVEKGELEDLGQMSLAEVNERFPDPEGQSVSSVYMVANARPKAAALRVVNVYRSQGQDGNIIVTPSHFCEGDRDEKCLHRTSDGRWLPIRKWEKDEQGGNAHFCEGDRDEKRLHRTSDGRWLPIRKWEKDEQGGNAPSWEELLDLSVS